MWLVTELSRVVTSHDKNMTEGADITAGRGQMDTMERGKCVVWYQLWSPDLLIYYWYDGGGHHCGRTGESDDVDVWQPEVAIHHASVSGQKALWRYQAGQQWSLLLHHNQCWLLTRTGEDTTWRSNGNLVMVRSNIDIYMDTFKCQDTRNIFICSICSIINLYKTRNINIS